jgi:hypothetical protein
MIPLSLMVEQQTLNLFICVQIAEREPLIFDKSCGVCYNARVKDTDSNQTKNSLILNKNCVLFLRVVGLAIFTAS